MKFISAVLFIVQMIVLPSVAAGPVRCARDIAQPMMGCGPDYKVVDSDKALIAKVKFDSALGEGWKAFYLEDFKTSVLHFNVAWLIERKSYRVLWAFGTWSGSQGHIPEALTYFRMANAQHPKDAAFNSDFGRTLTLAGETNKKDKILFNEAQKVFEQGLAIDPKHPGNYFQWSVLEFYRGNYAQAWDLVKQTEALDPQMVPVNYLQDLTKKMKRP